MAVLVDASTPGTWTGVTDGPSPLGDTSASFTAPSGALLVCVVIYDSTAAGANSMVVADSGSLTWTKQVEELPTSAPAGGGSVIWTAKTASAAARTVTAAYSGSGASNGTKRKFAACYVLTGADVAGTPVDTTGANNSGGNTTNNFTTATVTPGADGLLLCGGCDWNALGAPTSSDLTINAFHQASQISGLSGYKTTTNGTGTHGNLHAAAGTPQWKWVQITVRAAASSFPGDDEAGLTYSPVTLWQTATRHLRRLWDRPPGQRIYRPEYAMEVAA